MTDTVPFDSLPFADATLFAEGPALVSSESWRYQTLAQMIIERTEDAVVLVGAASPMSDARRVTLAELAQKTCAAAAWMQAHDAKAGELVLLSRISLDDDLDLAVGLLALLGCGLRVCLPMDTTSADTLAAIQPDWIMTPPAHDLESHTAHHGLQQLATTSGISLVPLAAVLSWSFAPAIREALLQRAPGDNVLLLSTSGSSGGWKWVRYHERALLACAEAWQQAGLMASTSTGGASLCPFVSHSMGVRNILHAVWSGQPTLLIPPHWFSTHPYRVVEALTTCPPAHVTGGPAIVHVFGEYLRRFPRLKQVMEPALKCFVSSGTAFDECIGQTIPAVRLANAYGTTETQQVLSTLLDDGPLRTLGGPYPGVRIALGPADAMGLQGLSVSAPFMAAGYLGEDDFDGWWHSGDQVSIEEGRLVYQGRQGSDFLKSGHGIKVARVPLEQALRRAVGARAQLLLEPHPRTEGLVILAFVGEQEPTDPVVQDDIAERLAVWIQEQREEHSFVEAFVPLLAVGFVAGQPPLRSVGKPDRQAVRDQYASLLTALATPGAKHPQKRALASDAPGASAQARYTWPQLGQVLEILDLEWDFTHGVGDTLFATRDGVEVSVLDLVGGYGVNLLGHGRVELQEAAIKALRGVPLLDQLSLRRPAQELSRVLARQMSQHTGRRWLVSLASTGGEAVEMALAHAALARHQQQERLAEAMRFAYGASAPALVAACMAHNQRVLSHHRPPLFALERAFHGKTIGAMAALGDRAQRHPFRALLGAETVFLPALGGADAQRALDKACADHTLTLQHIVLDQDGQPRIESFSQLDVLAVLVEPIQGEGGLYEVPLPWLQTLADVSAPLIVDEIQCGLGRAGSFLASEGIVGDYYLLGKALGGGIAKIAALLIEHRQYIGAFDQLRGSTFSGDALSCEVALEVMRLLEREQVAARAREVGARLRLRLEAVQARFPKVISAIRGRGLMLGVALQFPMQPPSTLLNALSVRGLGYLASSWLLANHQIRVLPTISSPDTLRIEPSYRLDDKEIERIGQALEQLCEAIDQSNLFALVAHLLKDVKDLDEKRALAKQYAQIAPSSGFQIIREAPAPGARRVAFVHNPVQTSKLLMADAPPFALLASTRRREVIDWFQQILELGPMPSFCKNFFGGKVWMMGITMAATPETLGWLKERGQLDLVHRQLQAALDIATKEGCETVTFGAFTSVVSHGATTLYPQEGVQVSSGNTFTVAVTADQVLKAAAAHGIDLKQAVDRPHRIGVVGALGNIGKTLSELLFVHLGLDVELMLLGREGSLPRLESLRETISNAWNKRHHTTHREILVSEDLHALNSCDVVIAATSTVKPIIEPHHITDERPVLLADISQPSAVVDGITRARPKLRFVEGGLVQLPEDPDFMMSAHTPPGSAFACASEALLMGLEPQPFRLTGDLEVEQVHVLYELGKKYGLLL